MVVPFNPYLNIGYGYGAVKTANIDFGFEGMCTNISFIYNRRSNTEYCNNDEVKLGLGVGFVNVLQVQYLISSFGDGYRIMTNIPLFGIDDKIKNWPLNGFLFETRGCYRSRIFYQQMEIYRNIETQIGIEFGISL